MVVHKYASCMQYKHVNQQDKQITIIPKQALRLSTHPSLLVLTLKVTPLILNSNSPYSTPL